MYHSLVSSHVKAIRSPRGCYLDTQLQRKIGSGDSVIRLNRFGDVRPHRPRSTIQEITGTTSLKSAVCPAVCAPCRALHHEKPPCRRMRTNNAHNNPSSTRYAAMAAHEGASSTNFALLGTPATHQLNQPTQENIYICLTQK